MVLALEEVEGVTAVEIGIPPGADQDLSLALLEAAVGELAVIACLPLEAAGAAWLKELPGLGVRGICLSAPRGAIFPRRAGSPPAGSHPQPGRLVGPGLAPLELAALLALRPLGLPLIAGSGVFSLETGRELLAAGAAAVRVDTLLWL
jgi:hypothetical protein